VDVRDGAQFDRFANGLDCPQVSPNEFQRFDDGPLPTLGDGRVTSSDRTQLDRYIAGLDPLSFAGGPTSPIVITCTASSKPDLQPEPESDAVTVGRIVRVISASGSPGTDVTVFVEMDAQGNEVATQYSVFFDPAALTISGSSGSNPDVTLGAGAPSATTLTVNATQIASGRLGIVENFNGGGQGAIPAGTKRIANVRFHIQPNAVLGTTAVIFGDAPVSRVTSDENGIGLNATYDQTGMVTVGNAAPVTVSGRVTTPDGRSVRNATVTITDQNNVAQSATTSSFGFYSFTNVTSGQTYTLRAFSRLFRFQPRTVMVNGDLTVDFVGLE